MNASGTPIEHTNARHVTVVAHASLPPTRHHAKLARGDGRPRAHHILWRGHGARTWLNADKLCARAPHSRLFMIMCVNTCLVARAMLTWLGGYRPPAWTTSQAQLAGPMVACVNHTKMFATRAHLDGDSVPLAACPSTRCEYARLSREKARVHKTSDTQCYNDNLSCVWAHTETISRPS